MPRVFRHFLRRETTLVYSAGVLTIGEHASAVAVGEVICKGCFSPHIGRGHSDWLVPVSSHSFEFRGCFAPEIQVMSLPGGIPRVATGGQASLALKWRYPRTSFAYFLLTVEPRHLRCVRLGVRGSGAPLVSRDASNGTVGSDRVRMADPGLGMESCRLTFLCATAK